MNARRSRSRCPTPSKASYADEELARTALETIQSSVDPGLGGFYAHMPDRPYQCTCGRWHLTSGYNGGIPGYYTRRAR